MAKDFANERNESLLSNCRVQLILSKEGRGDSNNSSFERRQVQSDTAMRNKYNFFQKTDSCNYL